MSTPLDPANFITPPAAAIYAVPSATDAALSKDGRATLTASEQAADISSQQIGLRRQGQDGLAAAHPGHQRDIAEILIILGL